MLLINSLVILLFTGLVSAQEIPPNSSQEEEWIPISKSDNTFADLGYQSQEDITDLLRDGAGRINFTYDIFENDFEIFGEDVNFGVRLNLRTKRRVHARNYGELDRRGIPLSPLRSVYTVIDQASNRITLDPRLNASNNLSWSPFGVRARIEVNRIYDVDNFEDYKKRHSPQEALKALGFSDKNIALEEKYNKYDSPLFYEQFSNILHFFESAFSSGADLFSDKEETQIFLQNFLEPLRLNYEFFDLTAEKLKNSPNIKPGEVIVHSIVLILDTNPFSISSSGLGLRVAPLSKEIALHSAFKKMENGEVLAKSVLTLSNSHQTNLSFEEKWLDLRLFRWVERALKSNTSEYGYKFDLNDPKHVAAFNDIFTKRWLGKDVLELPRVIEDHESLQNHDYVTFAKTNSMPVYNRTSKIDLELGFLSFEDDLYRQLVKETTKTNDGLEVTEYKGNILKQTKYAFRPNISWLKDKEETKQQIRSYVFTSPFYENKSYELSFEYEFRDNFSRKGETKRYIDYLNLALATQNLKNKSNIIKILHESIQSRGQVEEKRARQYFGLRISMTNALLESIIRNPNSIQNLNYIAESESFQKLLIQTRFYDQHVDKDNNVRCKVNNPRERNSIAHRICRAKSIAKSLLVKRIKKTLTATTVEERLILLNQMMRSPYTRALVPHLFLQIATIEKIENGKPIYRDIDELIKKGYLGFEMLLDGSGLQAPFIADYNKTNVNQRYAFEYDFDIHADKYRSKRIQARGAFLKKKDLELPKPDVYVQFNSPVFFNQSYHIVGEIYRYNFSRKDKLVKRFIVDEINMLKSEKRSVGLGTTYNYIFAVNIEDLDIVRNKNYIIRFRLQNDKDIFASEIDETNFKLPN